MKTLNTMAVALVLAVLLAAGLHAQQRTTLANIPFDFTVQTAAMPAGEYSLQELTNTSGLIRIQNTANGHAALALAPACLSKYQGDKGSQAKLVFHRYGERYFFAEIWMPDGGLRGAVKPSRLERELQANGNETRMALVNIPLAGAAR